MPFVAEENASNCSKRLAEKVFNAADRRNILGNRALPPEHFWRIKGIGMLRATLCPAILLECGFMDNRADLAFLQSPNGKQIIAELIVEAILAYEAELGL